jgi:hypothetical protein
VADILTEKEFLTQVVRRWGPQYEHVVSAVDPAFLQAGPSGGESPYQWYVRKLQRYVREYGALIPWEAVEVNLAEDVRDQEQYAAYRQAIWLLYSAEPTWGEEAVTRFRQYLAGRIYSTAFDKVREGLAKSKDVGVALDQGARAIESARAVLVEQRAHDLAEDYAGRLAAWERTRDNPGLKHRLEFGIPELDRQLRMEDGTVTALLGVFKRYKSITLNHLGIMALASGYNVAHVTYENEVSLTEDRYYSRLMTIRYSDLIAMRDAATRQDLAQTESFRKSDNHIRGLKTHLANRLKILKAVPKKTTVADVEAQLDALAATEGFRPDVTIWDYANLIGLAKEDRDYEERVNQETVIWHLQAHAKDVRHGGARPVIVMTAVQAKAEAVKAEHVGEEHVGKSIGIPQALDALIGINQTRQEKIDRKLRLAALVSRTTATGDEVTVDCDMEWFCIDKRTHQVVVDLMMRLFMGAQAR